MLRLLCYFCTTQCRNTSWTLLFAGTVEGGFSIDWYIGGAQLINMMEAFMNFNEIILADELQTYNVVYEKNIILNNNVSKEILIKSSSKMIELVCSVNSSNDTVIIDFKNNSFMDLIHEQYSDDDIDECVYINSQIYFKIKSLFIQKLNIEKVLTNTTIIDESKFKDLIEDHSYRLDCYHAILDFINTYKEHPSEEDLTLFLLGKTGKLLSDFLYEQGVAEYSREMNGYALTFKSSLNSSDYFIMDLVP